MRTATGILATIGLSAVAAQPALGADYFMKARPEQGDFYLYAGYGHLEADDIELWTVPVEATLFTPQDWEFSVRSEFVDYRAQGTTTSGMGEVQLRAGKYFRDVGKLDFFAVQLGGVTAIGDVPEVLRSGVDAFVRLRTQAGCCTRAKFEGNVVLAAVDDADGDGDELRSTFSAGIRSQFRASYIGADVLYMDQGDLHITSVDAVFMQRFWSGHSLYVSAQKDLDGGSDAMYFEIAAEFKF